MEYRFTVVNPLNFYKKDKVNIYFLKKICDTDEFFFCPPRDPTSIRCRNCDDGFEKSSGFEGVALGGKCPIRIKIVWDCIFLRFFY